MVYRGQMFAVSSNSQQSTDHRQQTAIDSRIKILLPVVIQIIFSYERDDQDEIRFYF
jgi:hypothetical protein